MTLFSYCGRCGARNDQAHYSNCTANDPPTAPDNGWRPINTAPKDGTPILVAWVGLALSTVWTDHYRATVAYWKADHPMPHWQAIPGDFMHVLHPHHWMPLPPPPTSPSVASRVPSTNQEP